MMETHSVGAIVLNRQGMVAVVEQPNKVWSLPKGHIEEGEEYLDALRRELYEEAGIEEFEFVKDLGSYRRCKIGLDGKDDPREEKVIHLCLCRTAQEEIAPTDPTHPSAKWVAKQDVPCVLTHPKDRAFFRAVMEELQ